MAVWWGCRFAVVLTLASGCWDYRQVVFHFKSSHLPMLASVFSFPAFSPNLCLRWFVLLLLRHVFVSAVYRLALRRRVVRVFVPCTVRGEGGSPHVFFQVWEKIPSDGADGSVAPSLTLLLGAAFQAPRYPRASRPRPIPTWSPAAASLHLNGCNRPSKHVASFWSVGSFIEVDKSASETST